MSIISSMVLLLAASLKWDQLAIIERTGGGVLHEPAVIVGLIMFEAALAVWLLAGIWPRWSRWTPGACFATFAAVALYQALAGAESCGCFGRVKISPWVTFGMDVLLTAGLWAWPPGREPALPWPRVALWPRAAVVDVVVAVALGMSLWRLPRPVAVGADGEPGALLQAGSLTILEPQRWIGKRLPVTAEIDVGERLRAGRWLVVLHSAHCSTCREALPGYEAEAQRATEYRVALIEMPPREHDAGQDDSQAVHGRLSGDREWFASTPVALLVEDGIVRDTAEGKAAVGLTADWDRMKLVPADQASARE